MIEPVPPAEGNDLSSVPVARPVDVAALEYASLAPFARRFSGWPAMMPWWRALLEIVAFVPLVFLLGVIGAVVLVPLIDDHRWANLAVTFVMGFVAVALAVGMALLNRHRLTSIGLTLRKAWLEALIGAGMFVLLYPLSVSMLLTLSMLFPGIMEHQADAPNAIQEAFPPISTAGLVLFCTGVAIYEEVAFRGFLLTRLRALFGRWWLAVPVSALLFGSMHLYEGPIAVCVTAVMGAGLGVLTIWRRSLIGPIVTHFLWNLTMFMFLRYFFEGA